MQYSSIIAFALLLLGGVATAQLSQTGMGKVANGGGPPPAGCTGVIDLTEGCPQPMLGL